MKNGKKEHIVFICSWYPNRHAPALGNFIRQHAIAASKRYQVSVLYACADPHLDPGQSEITTISSDDLTEFICYYGKIRSTLPGLSSLEKKNTYTNSILRLFDLAVRKHGAPSLFHLQVIWPAGVALLQLLRKHKVPVVISEHWSGYLPEDGNYKGVLLKYYSGKIASRASSITVVSDNMRHAMEGHGLGNSFVLLPNCIDEKTFYPPSEKKAEHDFRLLHVSMLVDREKNISGLLRVMKGLKDHSSIKLEIIGDGPDRDHFEKIASADGTLNRTVFFSGFRSSAEIADAMRTSSALIMFSHFEGMPVTIIESLMCGTPVIATRVGHIPNMIHPSNGILVDAGNEQQLTDAILQMKSSSAAFNTASISKEASALYGYEAAGKILYTVYQNALDRI